jgi:hypothetical protein
MNEIEYYSSFFHFSGIVILSSSLVIDHFNSIIIPSGSLFIDNFNSIIIPNDSLVIDRFKRIIIPSDSLAFILDKKLSGVIAVIPVFMKRSNLM